MCVRSVTQSCLTLYSLYCSPPGSSAFFREEYWNGLSFLLPRDLPNAGIEPMSISSPALTGGFLNLTLLLLTCPEKTFCGDYSANEECGFISLFFCLLTVTIYPERI